ncbi:MAG: OmpH family outer membrane protein [Acidobacteriota bacterium]
MRRSVIVAALALVASTAPAFAQTAPAPPAVPGAQAAQAPAPAPAAPAPFPPGAKIAFVDFQRVAAESVEGQISTVKINALVTKKQTEGADKAKSLQANQQKLAQSGSVMSEAARTALEKDIERQQREGERFQQDAQAEINELQQELQLDFQKKILPLVQQVREERGLQILFSRADAGIVSWDPGIDVTADVIKKLDAITPKGAAPAAGTRPVAPAAARPTAPAAPRPAAPAPAAPKP